MTPLPDEDIARLFELLEKSKAMAQRAEESIRKSEETLRAAKATLDTLREKLRRFA